MRVVSAILAAVALLACGCATQQKTEPVALEPIKDFKVSYSGALNAKPLEDLPEYKQAEGNRDLMYALQVRIIRCDEDKAEAVFGARAHTIGAWSMPADELAAERVTGLHVMTAPRLTVYEGQQGTITVTNQTSYVSGFDVDGKGDSRIADPVVDTVNDGVILGLRATAADEQHMTLALDLTIASLVRPIATQQVLLMGAPVTIQTPVVYRQRMKAQGAVAEDKVLVLTGMTDRNGDTYVLLISGKRVTTNESEQPKDK